MDSQENHISTRNSGQLFICLICGQSFDWDDYFHPDECPECGGHYIELFNTRIPEFNEAEEEYAMNAAFREQREELLHQQLCQYYYNQIPSVNLTSKDMESVSMCSICLEDFAINESVRKLTECCHCFHDDCILTWIESCKTSKTCPMCRAQLSKDDDEKVNGSDTDESTFNLPYDYFHSLMLTPRIIQDRRASI